MCATPSPEHRRRANSIAVEWRDCAWSPPIVVRNPEPATPRRLEIKPPSVYSAAADEINATPINREPAAQRRKGAKRMKPDQSCTLKIVAVAGLPEKNSSPGLCAFAPLRGNPVEYFD
jgi:hypothetical protein